jgi:hypothetical protein
MPEAPKCAKFSAREFKMCIDCITKKKVTPDKIATCIKEEIGETNPDMAPDDMGAANVPAVDMPADMPAVDMPSDMPAVDMPSDMPPTM